MQVSAVSAVSSSTSGNGPAVTRKAAAITAAPTATLDTRAVSRAANAPLGALSQVYATRVAGKDYSGEVAYASGVYTISVTGLPGAEGADSSLFAAENALNARIDILV